MSNDFDKEYEEYKEQGRIWGLLPKEKIKKLKFPRVKKEIIDQFLEIEDLTTSVSDVLDSLGINGAIPSSYLFPVLPGKKIAGTAVTIRSIPERKTPTKSYADKDFIKMATRDLYYIAEPGNLDVSNMGGQSCTAAKSCGLVGAVVYGAVRDISTIKKLDFPVWCCGTTPITGKFRIECIEMNGPVTVHNIVVRPGDFIVADDSGVCAVPAEQVLFVLEKIHSIAEEEEKMRELIESKVPLDKLRPLYRKRYK